MATDALFDFFKIVINSNFLKNPKESSTSEKYESRNS